MRLVQRIYTGLLQLGHVGCGCNCTSEEVSDDSFALSDVHEASLGTRTRGFDALRSHDQPLIEVHNLELCLLLDVGRSFSWFIFCYF